MSSRLRAVEDKSKTLSLVPRRRMSMTVVHTRFRDGRRRRVLALPLLAVLLLAGTPGAVVANTITVNANGDLQSALNAAQPGDVIVVDAGATFTGNFVLPKKTTTGPAIVMRSSASNGVLPVAGERIRPAVHAQYLPKLKSPNSLPALQTEAAASGWTIRFVEFLGNQGGFGDII